MPKIERRRSRFDCAGDQYDRMIVIEGQSRLE